MGSRPACAAGREAANWSRWSDSFDGARLSPEWLRMRNVGTAQWYAFDRDRASLLLVAGKDSAGTAGSPHFLGREDAAATRAEWTARFAFTPENEGDLAGLMAFIDEAHFLVAGIEQRAR